MPPEEPCSAKYNYHGKDGHCQVVAEEGNGRNNLHIRTRLVEEVILPILKGLVGQNPIVPRGINKDIVNVQLPPIGVGAIQLLFSHVGSGLCYLGTIKCCAGEFTVQVKTNCDLLGISRD